MSAITAKASRKMKKYAVLTREPRCFLGSFDFSWEQRKLGDIADIVGGGTPSTGNQSYWDGDIDWYAPAEIADQIYANSSQKKITGLGYENSSAKMLSPGTVLFTSRAGIGKTAILTRKGCTNQGFQSIVPHRGELDSYFIFSRTEELKRYGELVGAGSTFVEVSGKQMAVMELMMPPTMREQQTIGGFFQQLDHLITLHQRKCANLCSPSQVVFSLLFATSTFSWEQRKFEEIAVRSSVICSDDTLPRVEYEDIVSGTGRLNKDIYAKQSIKSGIAFHQGDVLYGKLRPYLQNWLLPTFDGLAVGDFWVLQPQNADSSFLYRLIQSRQFDEVANQSTGTKMPRADWKLVSKTVFSIPSNISEQAAIGTYFTALDSLITLHQRECISFTGRADRLILTANKKRTTSSWEQRKVSDLAEKTYGGGTPTTSNEAYWNGDIPWIQSSDVVDGKLLGVESRKRITQDGLNNSSAQLIPENSIAIITRVGVGKLAFMPYSYATSQDFLSLSKLNAEPLFTVYACYKKLQSELNAVQGTSIKGITKDELLAKNIMVPRYAEQQQIGAFFKQLDNLITLHQRKPFLMKWRTSDANRNQTNRLVL
mgnify:CR=1 FL=1